MIFVTVGNAQQGFSRLLDEVDRLAAEGYFKGESVFMQVGHNPDFRSTACGVQPFLSMEEFQKKMAEASLVICHGGCTVFQVLRSGKLPVVMPRMRRYGEHVNDHQVGFVKTLAGEGWLVPVSEAGELKSAIEHARQQTPKAWPIGRLQELVGQAILDLR